MTVAEAISNRLVATSAVTALVSERVYQLKLPQGVTLPAIRVQLVDVMDFFHLRGGDLAERSRVQTDVYAAESSGSDPYAVAAAVAEAVHTALNGQRFKSDTSPADLEITGMFRIDRRELYESEELREVRIIQDYIVWSRRVAA